MTQSLAIPSRQEVQGGLQAINEFQQVVQNLLVEGVDYGGSFPGDSKKGLLKPGAEKIVKVLNAEARYTIEKIVDYQATPPFASYDVLCEIYSVGTEVRLASGVGNANSLESKWRYRNAERTCPECGAEAIIKGKAEFGGGWLCWQRKGGCGAKWPDGAPEIEQQMTGKIINDDVAGQFNTILKIAKKRSLVDATLGFAVLSDIFTQDVEDLPGGAVVEGSSRPVQQEPVDSEPVTYGQCEYHEEPLTRRTPAGTAIHRVGDCFCNGQVIFDKQGDIIEDLRPIEEPMEGEPEPEAQEEPAEDSGQEEEDYQNGLGF